MYFCDVQFSWVYSCFNADEQIESIDLKLVVDFGIDGSHLSSRLLGKKAQTPPQREIIAEFCASPFSAFTCPEI